MWNVLFGAAKRPASEGEDENEARVKRGRNGAPADAVGACCLDALKILDAGESWTAPAFASALEAVANTLREHPCGRRPSEEMWRLKRRLLAVLPKVLNAAETDHSLNEACFRLVDEAVHSGFVTTATDKRLLVKAGAWKPALAIMNGSRWRGSASAATRKAAVRLYVHLAEHVSCYDDFCGMHREFWDRSVFLTFLKQMHMLWTVDELPQDMEADEWEMCLPDLEAVLKTIGCFMMFWMNDKSGPPFDIDVGKEIIPQLERMVQAVAILDGRHGKEISAKARADFLEEIVRLSGLLSQFVMNKFEEGPVEVGSGRRRTKELMRAEAARLLNLLVRVLMLRIPTCVQKSDAAAPGSGAMPADERQLDSEWVEGLHDHCQDASEEEPVETPLVAELFHLMVDMPAEEQKYRLECAAPLVPSFIATFSEQLRQNFVPPQLKDLKVVMNAVLQDDSSLASDLLEEVSFYPCLLDFTSKRAIIHTICEHQKLQSSSSEPIRLVVPRDNVLDGVCSSLNLQDVAARIEVPVEIEFRSGYSDHAGQELVDEGEDQGGLRRQWLDRASRHFIASDLFISPSHDAAHLASQPGLPTQRLARGNIFVPSPEAICKCVQENWEEQFELFGCILGIAILYKETIPVHFGHNFLRSVFGLKTDAQDLLPLLETVDATLHKKLLYILDGTYKTLGDSLSDALEQGNLPPTFVISESHCPELVKNTPLKEGGEKTPVTEENKAEFVNLLLDRILISGLAHQVKCFRRGLLRVVPEPIVQRIAELMSAKEIELMVCGIEEVDVDDWEKHTQYENGFTHDHQVVRWFWDVVRAMSQQARAALLSFCTGSSQVPSGGFRFLQPELFTIQRVAVTDRFPEAHTCANTIDLPLYSSREELEQKLKFAIQEAGDAFGRR